MAGRKSLGSLMPTKEPADNPSAALMPEPRRDTFYDYRNITPQRVRYILREAEVNGRVDYLYKLYDDMIVSDTRYAGLYNQIKSTIAGMPLRVITSEGRTEKEKDIAEEYATYAREMLDGIDAHGLAAKFCRAYLDGANLYSVSWRMDELPYLRRMWFPDRVKRVDGRHLWQEIDTLNDAYGELRVRTADDPAGVAISDLPDENHVFLEAEDGFERYSRIGVARKVIPWFIATRYVQNWWTNYVENYGAPLRVGKYPRGSSRASRKKLVQFLRDLGQNGYGVFPQGMDVQLVDASKQGQGNSFQQFMNKAHQEYGVLMLGQASTTGDDAEGSYAKSVTMNRIRLDILEHIAEIVAKGFRGLVKKGLMLNYGESCEKHLFPKIKPIMLDSTNAKERAQAAQIMSQMGVPVPNSWMYEKVLGSEKPSDGQEAVVHNQMFVIGEDEMPEMQEPNQAGQVANPAATEDKENDSQEGTTSVAEGGRE